MKMKKYYALVLSLILCFTLSQNAFAYDVDSDNQYIYGNATTLTASEKRAFAEEVTKQYSESKALNHYAAEQPYDITQINSLMVEAAFAEDQASRDIYLGQLEKLGIYQYPTETSDMPTPMSDSGDVSIDKPDIYYSVQEKVWIVANDGRWRSEEWKYEIPPAGGDVGGPDVFGVGFTNTSGDYNASVVRCFGILRNGWDGSQERKNDTYNRGDADSSTGFYFELQDSIERVDTTKAALENTYVGSEWFSSCTYSEEFADFSGTATGFYAHTWGEAVISGISLGIDGKTAGLHMTMEMKDYTFSAYGPDTKF